MAGSKQTWLNEGQAAALRSLMECIVPSDDGLGAAEVGATEDFERFATSNPRLQQLTSAGLDLLDRFAGRWSCDRFVDLSPEQKQTLLEDIHSGKVQGADDEARLAKEFFEQARLHAVTVYASDPRVWQKIGFPGPSCLTGGYPDFASPPKSADGPAKSGSLLDSGPAR